MMNNKGFMKFLKEITRFRYDEKEHIWHKKELKNVLVSGSLEDFKLSDEVNRDAHILLRVMGNDDADVLSQDVIFLGVTDNEIPPEINTAVVASVKKNSYGSPRVRHTKILCK